VTATGGKARSGTWTPWADVLCVECEYVVLKEQQGRTYPRRLQVLQAMNRTAEVAQPEGCLLGCCDTCQVACGVRDDVALLQQVGFKTSDLDWEGPFGWDLQQTGGMCAALVLSTEGREIVVTAMDGEFFVGEYARAEGKDAPCWDTALRTWKSDALYDEGDLRDAHVLDTMVDACARKAITFVREPGGAA
jgi:hypothetical protein